MRRLLFVLLLAAGLAHAEERTIAPAATGANRLNPDVALMSRAKPLRYADSKTFAGGLDDLRLYDAQGREMPYLLVAPASRAPNWLQGAMLSVASTRKTSGFELDLGRLLSVDRIRFDNIPAPFLKRLRLEASGDRQRWTLLAGEATVFDLPDDKLRNLEVPFTPGDFRYLHVTWDDASSARVTRVSASARQHIVGGEPEPVRVPVAFRRRASEPGKSRYKLQLPGRQLPVIAIELQIVSGDVFRDATVSEPRLVNAEVVPVPLGSAQLKRAQRAGGVAADLSIPITFPEGPDLELVVDDANNPPLAISGIVAHLAPLPWIYFESADGAQITARYGNARLEAPRYDLEASRKIVAASEPPHAQWSGAARPTTMTAEGEAPPILGGAPIDRDAFRYSRAIPQSKGLTTLLLDADVLARSCDLDDLRIVDARGNQVPYLVEHRDEPLAVTLAVPAREASQPSTSVYRLRMPYETMPCDTRLVLTTTAHVYERSVTLRRSADERHGREAQILGSEVWRSSEPDGVPPPLTFHVPQRSVRELELVVDEGDNAPLPIAGAQLLMPSQALRFYHPGQPLTLVYGNPRLSAPRYDLALLGPRLFGEAAREINLGASRTAEQPQSQMQKWLFWIVIAAAVLVLLVILVRLVGKGTTTGDTDSAPRPTT